MALQRQYLLQSSPCRAPGCSQRAHIRLSATDKGADSTDDLIGRAFRSLFGKARDDRKPFGLQRLDPSGPAFKSLYEASTSSEPAAAVEADTAEQALVRPLLTDTVLETATLRLAYSAQRDGWSAFAFHSCVDDQGPAIVLGRTEQGVQIGGYNPCGWEGLGQDWDTRSAFLFCWPEAGRPGIRLPKVGGGALAIQDSPSRGPAFGAEGLTIPLDGSRTIKSRLGPFYAKLPSGQSTLFPPEDGKGRRTASAQLIDLKASEQAVADLQADRFLNQDEDRDL